jgi:predicted PolB exonuclease-like 3'-5' exonuclease
MLPVLAFDIETIPDVAGIRRLHDLPADLPDQDVAEIAAQRRRVQTGNDFLPPYLHRVIVISCVMRTDDGVQVFSIGEPEASEAASIKRFFEGIDRYVPQLVSWNGRGFDLPVLVNRALQHGVGAACFWETGRDNQDFRYNNYINRFHERHVDLMDVLSLYGGRGSPLDDMARLSGFPGKVGIGGNAVWESYRRGELAAIRNYCEADCVNTYLLFLRFQLMRCVFDAARYTEECGVLRAALEKRPEPHWREFLSLWKT